MTASKLRQPFPQSSGLRSSPLPFIRSPFFQYRPASYQHFPGSGKNTSTSKKSLPQGSFSSETYPFQRIWQAHGRKFLIFGVCASGFYAYNLETVPVSGRRRFNCISNDREAALGKQAYMAELQELKSRLLPATHPLTQKVAKVVERLLPNSGLSHQEWVVHVINDPEQRNAFVLPGGKVFVYTGMIDFAQDDDTLAAVLGHEIAHNVCHHTAEKMSDSITIMLLAGVLAYSFDISGGLVHYIFQYIYNLPQGRLQEAEADEVGLSMMAQSCFDPNAAYRLWKRMENKDKDHIPQFLSTHPSHKNRSTRIQELLPQAEAQVEESGCGSMRSYRDQFQSAFHGLGRDIW